MPADTNAYGDIFGGWLLSQMDLGGAVFAAKIVKHRIATVGINEMSFHRPVAVGDTVCCYAALEKQGRTSLTVRIEAWTARRDDGIEHQVTEGLFTFVAVDENRKPRPIGK